jgi:ketosteroid isomerase-like protein
VDFRRTLPWMLAVCLAALLIHGPIGRASAPPADPTGGRRAVRELTAALRSGDLSQLIASYARDADHRDLEGGRRLRGPSEIGAFLEQAYGREVGGDVDVASFQRLTADVVIAQLSMDRAGGRWPPYVTVLLQHRGGEWRLIATRAGGNPDTRERGLPAD